MDSDARDPLDPLLRSFVIDGRLVRWPAKYSRQLAAARWVADRLDPDAVLTEKELNARLTELHTFGDVAMLRRYLVDLRLLDRCADGSQYVVLPRGELP
jgi:hypothetical protein